VKKNIWYIFALFLSFSKIFGVSDDAPVVLKWKWNSNQVLELNEYHDVLFRMGTRTVAREDKNRVVMKTKECSDSKCLVDSWFDTYVRFGKTTGPYLKDKDFQSTFTLFRNGRYEVPDKFIMPNLRSFPSFPEEAVRPNDVWKIPAEESFDFVKERIRITVEPEYVYLGKYDWDYEGSKGRAEKITYTYPIFYTKKNLENAAPNIPVKIFGFAHGAVYFDAERGVPEFKDVKLSYTFIYPNGTVQEANFHIQGIYTHRTSIGLAEKNSIREEVLQDLIVGFTGDPTSGKDQNSKPLDKIKQDEKDPISVKTTEEGITFSLDSILFDFNDSELKPEAKDAVKRIAEILKKYPEREIRVSGHTDNVGKPDYNQKLSEERAKSVLDNLVKQHNLNEKSISYKGYADKVPVVSNDSEENRQKNRRVEITLVLD
jgi:outer membrane protein OmpA-like peptidoglycan-associated protein